ncbi:NYN domain protein [Corynebacterium urogenitale]|uniref:NYN domain protein n=2 Tax=Corynebacterium urogenitale TaxID=2487892 RepID=A0A5J6Z3L3_9CORY|nr:NYN domain protein [Corynebacterium urogenitale]
MAEEVEATEQNQQMLQYGNEAQTVPSLLLVWDAPNIDMGLGSILGNRPTAAHRPRFDAIGRWLISRAEELTEEFGSAVVPEATVFTNIAPGSADLVRPWVDALRNVGFAVFAKPKVEEDTDVDEDMLVHIRRRQSEGVLDGVVVASADGRNFKDTLEELAEDIPVTVLGFEEHANWAVDSEVLEFVDLEKIPGVFREPLPRVSLDNLPDDGAWLQPFRPLGALLD